VTTNLAAQTTLTGLYACGEVACTGLHGANRLASNSLLEAVVLAHNAADQVLLELDTIEANSPDLPAWVNGNARNSDEQVVLAHNLDELKRTLWDYVGIVRTTKRLNRARRRVENLEAEINQYYWDFKVDERLLELRNMILVAKMIIDCALQRSESRGLHYTLDFPDKLRHALDTKVQIAHTEPETVTVGVK
jgi:L-aspartate oxidase